MTDRELLCRLMGAAGQLWQVVNFKSSYGKTWMVFRADAKPLPYDKALAQAIEAVRMALEQAGELDAEGEVAKLTLEAMKAEHLN